MSKRNCKRGGAWFFIFYFFLYRGALSKIVNELQMFDQYNFKRALNLRYPRRYDISHATIYLIFIISIFQRQNLYK